MKNNYKGIQFEIVNNIEKLLEQAILKGIKVQFATHSLRWFQYNETLMFLNKSKMFVYELTPELKYKGGLIDNNKVVIEGYIYRIDNVANFVYDPEKFLDLLVKAEKDVVHAKDVSPKYKAYYDNAQVETYEPNEFIKRFDRIIDGLKSRAKNQGVKILRIQSPTMDNTCYYFYEKHKPKKPYHKF